MRIRPTSWSQRLAWAYSLIWMPCSHASPLRISAQPSMMVALASRSDFTSEPTSTMPASIRSWMSKSWVALRLVATTLIVLGLLLRHRGAQPSPTAAGASAGR